MKHADAASSAPSIYSLGGSHQDAEIQHFAGRFWRDFVCLEHGMLASLVTLLVQNTMSPTLLLLQVVAVFSLTGE